MRGHSALETLSTYLSWGMRAGLVVLTTRLRSNYCERWQWSCEPNRHEAIGQASPHKESRPFGRHWPNG